MDDETFLKEVEEFLKYTKDVEYQKDYSILNEFTVEELTEELCRRTGLGRELE